jgi:very-short-patch-repair endonuclease
MAEKILTAALLRNQKLKGLEKKVWSLIGERRNPWRFIPQFPMHGYILDFYAPEPYKVALEVDGPAHVNRREHDFKREKILLSQGIRTMHITAADLNIRGSVKVLEYIQNFMNSVNAED